MIEEEIIWKDIDGYEGLYQISNTGLVKSLERKVSFRFQKERIRKPHPNQKGYLVVTLSNSNGIKAFAIHRLVARYFVNNPNPEIYNEVNHEDGDKLNNNDWNLKWCTRSYNNQHAIDMGLRVMKGFPGDLNPNKKINKATANDIRILFKAGMSRKELAAKYGISKTQVSRINVGKSW